MRPVSPAGGGMKGGGWKKIYDFEDLPLPLHKAGAPPSEE